jgi:uncharacterized protein
VRVVRAHALHGSADAQKELARRLARRKQHDEALSWFRSAARTGDSQRQMELGIFLSWERGAHREGLKWIRRAAEQGHIGAQYFMGAELATGENVRKNLREAASWYRRAAKQNHSEAQYNLALMYWAGEGLARNARQAHKWLERAASSGDLFALRAMAEAYESGYFGYRKNRLRAGLWRRRYERASKSALRGAPH